MTFLRAGRLFVEGALKMKPGKRNRYRARDNLAGFAFISANMIWLLAFTAFPVLFSLFICFEDWNPLGESTFVGLRNFVDAFKDIYFIKALTNNVSYAIVTISGGLVLAIVMALILQRIKLKGLFRTLYFIPTICSSVTVAVIWLWLLEPGHGFVNTFLRLIHIQGPGWLIAERWAPISLYAVVVWQNSGFWMVVFLTGLLNISDNYFEAARIDGANAWQLFWRITLPLLTPTIFFFLTLCFITCWQQFDISYNFAQAAVGAGLNMMTSQTGPGDSLILPVQHIYSSAFFTLRVGYAAAMSWIITVIALVIAGANFVLARKWVVYES
jgi:multiple sugar transport system permease protein